MKLYVEMTLHIEWGTGNYEHKVLLLQHVDAFVELQGTADQFMTYP